MTDGPHAEGSTQPTSGQAAELTQSALSRAVVSPHDQIREMMNAAKEGAPIFGDPRRPFALTDTFLATLSRHFAAVEDVVYPEVHKRLDNGKAIAAEQIHLTRQMELVMRMIEGSFYGDAYSIVVPRAVLWEDMAAQLDEHIAAEQTIISRLDEVLDGDAQGALADAFAKAVERAPTRPHPYTPHSTVLGRLSHRLLALADHALDTMDGRIIPTKPPKVHGSPDSLLTQYLLGHEREHPQKRNTEPIE